MKTLLLASLLICLSVRARAATAVATIKSVGDNSLISGTVTFKDTDQGLKVVANITGLTPGQHGFHIHEFGSCADGGNAAGGRYSPFQSARGALNLGNIEAAADGTASARAILPGKLKVTGGKYDVAGRAVIIQENADDFSQPTGNAGARIACGAIKITAD